MGDRDNTPSIRHEAANIHAANAKLMDRYQRDGIASPRDRHLAWTIENQGGRVQHLDRARFRLPDQASRFVGKAETRSLQALLY
jgi:hypothetical protein